MCGFIGIYGPEGVDVAGEVYEGLLAVQHRGQDAAGITTFTDSFHVKKGLGLVLEVFNESNMARLRGNLGVGHVRYPTLGSNQGEDAQPFHLPYPIGVALAMHANFHPDMADYSDVIAGYQTYPHVDIYDTGVRAAKPIIAMINGASRPTMAWGNRPMLPHVMRQGSDDFPNRELQAMAQRMESQGALAASFFTGFPHADIELAGSSAVVVTDNDMARAEKLRDELLDFAWDHRSDFIYEIEPLETSLERAAEMGREADGDAGPVVLLDHYDNAASGGAMDTMTVLATLDWKELHGIVLQERAAVEP